MKRLFMAIVFMLVVVACYSQDEFSVIAQDSLIDKLNLAVKKEDSSLLLSAFAHWQSNVLPWNSEALAENELIRDINNIIAVVYSKEHMEVVKNSSFFWDGSLENDSSEKFTIFHGESLEVRFTNGIIIADSTSGLAKVRRMLNDSLGRSDFYRGQKWSYYRDSLKITSTDTVYNIKPNILLGCQNVLIVTDSIGIAINKLVEKAKKRSFFYAQVSVLRPWIQDVTFDESVMNCLVSYRWEDRGGRLILRKINGEWEIYESEITWIQ